MLRRRVPFVPQVQIADCGPAALASVLAYYGRWEPLENVRRACAASRDGSSALAILRAAESFDMQGDAFKATFEDLQHVRLPAIVHWNFNHFVIVERVTRSHAVVVDPSAGQFRILVESAARSFSGVILTFAPGPGFRRKRRARPALAQFARQLSAERPSILQIIMISACIQLLSLSLPFATKLLMDAANLPSYAKWIAAAAVALGGGIAAGTALNVARGILLQNLQTAVDHRLSVGMVRHLLNLPLTFFLQRRSGDVMQQMNSTEAIRTVLTATITSSILDAVTLVVYIGFAFHLSPLLGAIIAMVGAAKAIALWHSRKATRELLTAEMIADGTEMTSFIEMFSALETVRATRSEQYVIERWHRNAIRRSNDATKRRRYDGYEQMVRSLLSAAGLAAILAVGAGLAASDTLGIGALAAVVVIHGLLNTPLDSMLNALGQLQHIDRHIDRVEDITGSAAERSGSVIPIDVPLDINLNEVSFQYTPTGRKVLSRISLSIAAGEHVAFVGPTGAGKSTLARMFVGLIEPTEGQISFGGTTLSDIDRQWLRGRVAIVLQDVALLDEDVLTNLRLYRPNASLAEVQQAAAMAAIDDVIEKLDDGYAHVLRKNGSTLSGGERQRLAIARALLARPSVLILDEATSALDQEAESRIFAHISRPGFTRISVAHRLETVRNADRIYVLDDGQIVQVGRYDDLMEQENGVFRSLAFING